MHHDTTNQRPPTEKRHVGRLAGFRRNKTSGGVMSVDPNIDNISVSVGIGIDQY